MNDMTYAHRMIDTNRNMSDTLADSGQYTQHQQEVLTETENAEEISGSAVTILPTEAPKKRGRRRKSEDYSSELDSTPRTFKRIPAEMITLTKGSSSDWDNDLEVNVAQKKYVGIKSNLLNILKDVVVPDIPDEVFIERLKKGDQEASFYLLCRHYRYILAKILEITSGNWYSDDILQAGAVGLYEAANRFDKKKGNLFLTYAHYWILKYIYIEVRNDLLPLGGLGVGRDAKERLFNFIKYQMYGLSDEEIRKELKISVKTLNELKILSISSSRIRSLDVVKSDDDNNEHEAYNLEGVPTHKSAECEYLSNELTSYVEEQIRALKESDPRIAKFLAYNLGVCGEYQRTRTEICKLMGISTGTYHKLRRTGNKFLRMQMIHDGWYDATKEEVAEAVAWFEKEVEKQELREKKRLKSSGKQG